MRRLIHRRINAIHNALQVLAGFILACSAQANTGTQMPIEMPAAYQKIAQDFGIPPEVLFAVMLTESSKQIALANGQKKLVPWPWTLNVELKSYYFKTQDEAKVALRQFVSTNNKRIAVGLGQIYLPSHGHLFPDVTELLEPGLNLHYAAQLLVNNFKWTVDQGKPNWWVAVGRYHTPSRLDLAMPYREGVYRRCERLSPICARYGSIARNEMKFR
jgi:Transglycosylase SLT domain